MRGQSFCSGNSANDRGSPQSGKANSRNRGCFAAQLRILRCRRQAIAFASRSLCRAQSSTSDSRAERVEAPRQAHRRHLGVRFSDLWSCCGVGRRNVFTSTTVKTSLRPDLHEGSDPTVPQNSLKFRPGTPRPIYVTDFRQGVPLPSGWPSVTGVCAWSRPAGKKREPTATP